MHARKLFARRQDLATFLDGAVAIRENSVEIVSPVVLRERMEGLIYNALFHSNEAFRSYLLWLIREAAAEMEVVPASLEGYFFYRGRNRIPGPCVPAFNLRVLAFDTARACFRAAREHAASAVLFQISPAEIDSSGQTAHEIAACVFGAGVAEHHAGPVFLQADCIGPSPFGDRLAPRRDMDEATDLIAVYLDAGFFNFNLDTSALADLTLPTDAEQEEPNAACSAKLADFIRGAQPPGVSACIGAQIPIRLTHNATADHVRAFADSFTYALHTRRPGAAGLSKVCIGTETENRPSPGGNGAALLEFNIVNDAGEAARRDLLLAGAVLHDVTGFPENLFARLADSGICEAHLAARIQNQILDHPQFPVDIKEDMIQWLDQRTGGRHQNQTEEFYFSERREALWAFRRRLWDIADEDRAAIFKDLQKEISSIMTTLGIHNTVRPVLDTVRIKRIHPPPPATGLHPTAENTLRDLLAGE